MELALYYLSFERLQEMYAMSVINTNIGNSGHYQLDNASGGTGRSVSPGQSLTSALLNAGNTTDPASFSAAYLLDLSPEAQQYLAGSAQATTAVALQNDKQTFTLSKTQRAEITAILEQFRDKPFTQDTFNAIQDALTRKGLGPQQLSMIDKSTSFNPTQLLINALTGRNAGEAPDLDGSKTKAKVDNYLQQIVGQWKSISTTVNEEGSAAEEVASDAVAPASGAEEG